MAILVAVLYAYSDLTAENEITAMTAGGVNPVRLLMPLVGIGVILAGGMFLFNDRVLPEANHSLRKLLVDVTRKTPTLQLREQVVNEISASTENQYRKYYLQAVHIDPVTLTLADGPIPDNGADIDTFYEEELEAYSQAGVNTILEADYVLTVEHIEDGLIEGGSGDIALRTVYNNGRIEFLPETEGDPITTTVHTTGGGDIFMLAGSGGILTGTTLRR